MIDKAKILMVHVRYRLRGGEEAVFENEVQLLKDAGFDVVPLTFSNESIQDQTLIGKLKAAIGAIWSHSNYKAFCKILDKERPDVVHFHNIFPLLSPSVYKACCDKKIPVVQTLHNYRWACPAGTFFREGSPCELCLSNGLHNAVKYSCYRNSKAASAVVALMILLARKLDIFRRYVDRIIVLTRFAERKMISAGMPAERIVVKPNFGLEFHPSTGSDSGYVLFIGRVSKEKGIGNLVAAAQQLEKNIEIQVAGDGPEMAEMKAYADKLGVNVRFLGQLDSGRLSQVIDGCAFVVVPSSWYEGFPMVILDAYSHSKPVLAADIGGLPELIEPGQTGAVCDCTNAQSFAAKLGAMWSNKEKLGLMGEQAYKKYCREYSGEANLAHFNGIYGTLLE